MPRGKTFWTGSPPRPICRLVIDAPPPGTFNYIDTRSYAAEEAIDVLNSVLLTKGYTLVRRERMLLLINLEDGIPPNLVTTVPVQESGSARRIRIGQYAISPG